MAHEAVHCLAPVGWSTATFLEEGLATVFAGDLVAKQFDAAHTASSYATGLPRYDEAAELVRILLVRGGDAGIRTLRANHPQLSPVDPATILAAFPELSSGDARTLSLPFHL
jgi:hypothetical protein